MAEGAENKPPCIVCTMMRTTERMEDDVLKGTCPADHAGMSSAATLGIVRIWGFDVVISGLCEEHRTRYDSNYKSSILAVERVRRESS